MLSLMRLLFGSNGRVAAAAAANKAKYHKFQNKIMAIPIQNTNTSTHKNNQATLTKTKCINGGGGKIVCSLIFQFVFFLLLLFIISFNSKKNKILFGRGKKNK